MAIPLALILYFQGLGRCVPGFVPEFGVRILAVEFWIRPYASQFALSRHCSFSDFNKNSIKIMQLKMAHFVRGSGAVRFWLALKVGRQVTLSLQLCALERKAGTLNNESLNACHCNGGYPDIYRYWISLFPRSLPWSCAASNCSTFFTLVPDF